MKKYTLSAILFAATLFSCGTDSATDLTSEGSEVKVVKTELTFNLSGKDPVSLTGAKGVMKEKHGNTVLTFEGDNGEIDIFISSAELKAKEYGMDLEDLDAVDVLASYTIKSDGEKSYCCGKSGEDVSSGSITITSIGNGVVSGEIDAKSYDGSSIVGSFGAVIEK